MGTKLDWHISMEDLQMAKRCRKKMFIITYYSEMQIKTKLSSENGVYQKKMLRRVREKGIIHC